MVLSEFDLGKTNLHREISEIRPWRPPLDSSREHPNDLNFNRSTTAATLQGQLYACYWAELLPNVSFTIQYLPVGGLYLS